MVIEDSATPGGQVSELIPFASIKLPDRTKVMYRAAEKRRIGRHIAIDSTLESVA